ncbi:MAG TPA: tetratricopeptide repeat protein [Bryobacteraceae bacterium]|nr:tetratricopeptide repeat protein [Bryobacteraceae bacterium]
MRAAGDGQSCASIQAKLRTQDRPELHSALGDCEEAAGDFREAANQYQIAARADPTEQNLFVFGSELLKYRGYSQGLQVFTYSAGRYPDSARIRVGLGIAQYSLGQYQQAVESLCQAVDLAPADTRALDFLGKMIGVAPELSKQIESRLKRFARLYPKNAAANYYYALSLRTSGANDQAEMFLQRAVAEAPAYAEAHYELGLIYADSGRTKRAVDEYLQAVRYKPDLSAAHYRLAQLYAKEGQTEQARREFEIVKGLRPR